MVGLDLTGFVVVGRGFAGLGSFVRGEAAVVVAAFSGLRPTG
jgi:hypothetical protein